MTKRPRRSFAARQQIINRLLWWFVAAFAIVIPIYISSNGEDRFRLPKELLVRGEAIALLTLLLIGAIRRSIDLSSLRQNRALVGLLVLASAVGAIVTITSTNVGISVRSIAYLICWLVIFCATYIAIDGKKLATVVFVGTTAAILNSLVAVTQRLNIWNPFVLDPSLGRRERITALVGNPNDVGALLALCAIALAAHAAVRRSPIAIITTIVVSLGVVASDTYTAMAALLMALIALSFTISRRFGAIAAVALVLTALAGFAVVPSMNERAQKLVRSAREHDYDRFTSHRLVAFAAASLMFCQRPLVGLGPGTFRWQYLPYRLRAETRYPSLYLTNAENYGEVHSDHLQLLAEDGLIGYTVFLSAVVFLATRTWAVPRRTNDARLRFVRNAALPLAVVLSMLALTGFPLELAAASTPLTYFAAVICRWSRLETFR